MKLELMQIPVTDIDRAKAFYVEKMGFDVDVDIQPNDKMRIIQLTPPGSACSIGLWAGISNMEMKPGSVKGLHLVVGDINEAREALIGRGVEVGEVDIHDQGVKYAAFSDPDGNAWTLQEMPWRSSEF
ncbi:MAG TPA: VOC family protein [Ktedonosporobacter sp.]|nr:VOC family protein [Ktedonosporobacter sp.]